MGYISDTFNSAPRAGADEITDFLSLVRGFSLAPILTLTATASIIFVSPLALHIQHIQ